MTAHEFKAIRKRLGISVNDLAEILGLNPSYIRHMEMAPEKRTASPINSHIARLMIAYDEGYRPKNWPARKSA